MKNKVLSLLLVLTFLVSLHKPAQVLAAESAKIQNTTKSSWVIPVTIACSVAAVVGIGCAVYKAYDYHCFKNKVIKISDEPAEADNFGNKVNPRRDIDLHEYIQHLLKHEIPKLKKSPILEVRHIANIHGFIVTINVCLERSINIETSKRLAAYLRNKDEERLIPLMTTNKSIKVVDLIEELQKIDALVLQATKIIDENLYK